MKNALHGFHGTVRQLCLAFLVAVPAVWVQAESAPGVDAEWDRQAAVTAGHAALADNLLTLLNDAMAADPQFRAAEHDRDAVAQVARQALAGYLPDSSAIFEKFRVKQEILRSSNAVFGSGVSRFPRDTWTVNLSQPILDAGRYIRIKQAEEEYAQAQDEVHRAYQDMILRLSEAYIGVLVAEDEIRFLEAERAAVAKQLELAKGREKSAVGRKVDTYDAMARLASVLADQAAAMAALQDANQALESIVGRTPQKLSPLRDDVALFPPEPAEESFWVSRAIASNPLIEAQRHAVEVARKEIQRQKAGHYPVLEAIGRLNNEDTGGTLFGGGSEVETRDMALRLTVPIYSGGGVSARRYEAESRYLSAREELVRLRRETLRQTRNAYQGLLTSIQRADALLQALTAQEATLELRRASFEARVETVLSVLDAERDFYAVGRDLTRSRYDYLLGRVQLAALAGELSGQTVQEVNHLLQTH